MPAENHVHQYVRVDGSKERYMCFAPTCTHHSERKFLVNKLSSCPACSTNFVLTRDDLRLKTPKCLNCRNTKAAIAHRAKQEAIKETIESIFKEESPLDEHGNEAPKKLTFEDILGLVESEDTESGRENGESYSSNR